MKKLRVLHGKSTIWLAILLLLSQALLPAVTDAASARKTFLAEICTVYGVKKFQSIDTQDNAGVADHQCRICALAHQPALALDVELQSTVGTWAQAIAFLPSHEQPASVPVSLRVRGPPRA